MKRGKRIFSLLLCAAMLLSMLPSLAQAEESTQTAVDSGEITVEGTNGVGMLLSEEIQDHQTADDNAGGYNVVGLSVENGVATAEFRTLETAVLVVALYTEDGMQLLASGNAEVQPEDSEVSITLEGDIPEYFMASAYLVDTYDHSPLCTAYETPMYTREMQELLASSVDDYDADLVLNLDDSVDTNFAVYEESTIQIPQQEGVNTVVTADNETATYIFENVDESITSLKEGDVFAYAYNDTDVLLAKVGTITVDGTTATVIGAELSLDEVFSHMKLESDGSTEDVTVDESTAADGITYVGDIDPNQTTYAKRAQDTVEETVNKRFSIECTIENGEDEDISAAAKLTGYLDMNLTLLVDYYLTTTRQQLTCKISFGAELNVNLSGNISTSLDLPKLGYEPVKGVLFLGFAPKLKVEFEGEIDFTAKLTATAGFSYDGAEGFQSLNTAPRLTADSEMKLSVYFGLDLAPNLRLEVPYGEDKSMELLTVEFTTEVGAQVEAVLESSIIDTDETQETKLHDCKNCMSVTVTGKLQFNASLNILELFQPKTDFDPIEKELMKLYYSYDYDEWGQDECPHYTYRVTVQVKNQSGINLSGVEVICDTESWGTTNKNGVLIKYMPAGTYTVSVTNYGRTGTTKVTVSEPVSVPVTLGKTVSVTSAGAETGSGIGSITADTVKDSSTVIASGYYTCYWELTANGRLYVSGAGVQDGHTPPWGKYSDMITTLVILEGVNYLGMHSFRGLSKLSTVVFGPDVDGIGWGAFIDCDSLRSIHIPDNVSWIGKTAFSGCDNLTKVYVGNEMTSGTYPLGQAFDSCPKLQGIYVAEDNPYLMDVDGVVYNKEKTRLVYCPAAVEGHFVIPDGVTYIDQYAFYRYGTNSALNAVTIPDGVTYIGDNAFSYNYALKEITFVGDAPSSGFGNNCFYGVTATVYYPADNETWTSDVMQNYGGTLTWTPYGGTAAEDEDQTEEAALETVTVSEDAPVLYGIWGGDYTIEVTETYTVKTASFKDLVPGEEYLLLALKSLDAEVPLTPDNVLYIDQATAGEDGTLVFRYVQREDAAGTYVMACGASNQNLKDAVITFPVMMGNGVEQAVEPTVTYNGEVLTEGEDYTLVGTVDYSTAGTYTCYIRGIYDYTGLVECTYTVDDHEMTEDYYHIYIKLGDDYQVNMSLTKNLYIDLNGYCFTGTLTTNGHQVYGIDSSTDSYTCENMGYFNCVDENGNAVIPEIDTCTDGVVGNKRYLTVETENGYTFHRFYLGITHISLKPSVDGVGYKAMFAGDEMVQARVDSYGYSMLLGNNDPYTVEKNGSPRSGRSITLRIENYQVEEYLYESLGAWVFITVDGETIPCSPYFTTLKEMVLLANDNMSKFTAAQQAALQAWIDKYELIESVEAA